MTLHIILGFPVHIGSCVIMVLPSWLIKIQISMAFMAPTDIGILSLLFILCPH